MDGDLAPTRRRELRGLGMLVTSFDALLIVPALILFFGLAFEGTTDEVGLGYLLRLELLGGLPTLAILAGAGFLAWHGARASSSVRLGWAAGLVALGVVWLLVWALYAYMPYAE